MQNDPGVHWENYTRMNTIHRTLSHLVTRLSGRRVPWPGWPPAAAIPGAAAGKSRVNIASSRAGPMPLYGHTGENSPPGPATAGPGLTGSWPHRHATPWFPRRYSRGHRYSHTLIRILFKGILKKVPSCWLSFCTENGTFLSKNMLCFGDHQSLTGGSPFIVDLLLSLQNTQWSDTWYKGVCHLFSPLVSVRSAATVHCILHLYYRD